MTVSNTNNAYIFWDGVDLSGKWTEELSYKPSADSEDITAGAGAVGVARAPKLIDATLDLMVVYEDASLATYLPHYKEGTVAVLTYGPEGNTTGKPKFSGSMHLKSSEFSQSVDKKKIAFKLSFEQAATPTHRIQNGDTF